MIKLYTPFPSAWNMELEMIQKPAKTKLKLIVLRAGIPIASIVSDASNSESNVAGNNWNTATPTNIMLTAIAMLNFKVA